MRRVTNPDWKAKYEEEKSRYEELSQYEAIIDRMKQDEALVDVLEAHIRGEIPGARAASANDSNSDDDFWRDVDETEAAGYQAPKPPEQKLYTKEEVEAEKARAAAAAEVKKELDNVLRYLGENGVPESVQNEFIAFVGNPSGVTGMDLLNVFKTVKERAGAPIEIKQQDEKHGGSIMDVAGKSDKPDPNRYLSQEDAVASNYKADPNNL